MSVATSNPFTCDRPVSQPLCEVIRGKRHVDAGVVERGTHRNWRSRRDSQLEVAGTLATNPATLLHDTLVPNSVPMAAVAAMAKAPHKVTRPAPTHAEAPPDRAASAPSAARQINETPGTANIALGCGTSIAVKIGKAAPTAKVAADDSAAWRGRARSYSERPSSSRA